MRRVTVVWVGLMAATCVSTWGLAGGAVNPGLAVVGIFGIAALKVRFVLLDFMELRGAPVAVRAAFEVWIAVVTLVVLGLWFATPAAAPGWSAS